MKTSNQFFNLKTVNFILAGYLLIIAAACRENFQVVNLRCEYLRNPYGIDIQKPRFAWNMVSGTRGTVQTAYRILLSENLKDIQSGKGSAWDSGKILSDNTCNIPFEGAQLKSGTTYYWNVFIWDQDGKQATCSEAALLHTGLLNQGDWQAKWISAEDTLIDAPLLRKEFSIGKKIREAYAYVTCAGYYEFYLNGEKIGDHVMDPGMTDYSKTILYSTYDITDKIVNGTNVAGAFLGNGAYNLKRVEDRYSWAGRNARKPQQTRFLMQIVLKYSDGTKENIISDKSWRSSTGPVTFNNIYGGEDYDARLEKTGWADKDFDASGWQAVKVMNSPGGILRSQLMPPIRVTATLAPVASIKSADGVYLFDMGQNYAGWWMIKAEGEPGLRIRIRGAETLNDSLFPEPLKEGDKLSIKQRYHSNVWTDYTFRGNGEEIYEPRFFYTGIRYVEVVPDDPAKLKMVKAEGRVVGTDLDRNGKFVTSDSLLNRIHRASIWSQKGNTHSYPTDCPHREKGGYTGDGQIVAEAAIHDFQMAAFYTKWLNDMRDAQQENGRIPNTSPTLVGGSGGGIAWGSAYILIPWWMYQYYNDTRIMEEHYPTMKKYIDYLRTLAKTDSEPKEAYIINNFGGYWDSLGEWCAPGQSDCPNHPVISTAYYYLNSLLMSRIASALGNKTDALYYSSLADTVRNEFNKKFFNPSTALYGTEETYQPYQLLALATDLVPAEFSEQVMKTVLDDIIVTRKGHLNTGIIGTKYLWPVLSHEGRADLAWTILKQTTYPGYGYWIIKGSTTLLEEWAGRNSHNHQMFGSVDEFFFKYLAGIWSPEDGLTSPGYKHVHIQPYIPEGLDFVESSLNTISGRIGSAWKQEKGILHIIADIPANTTATISIPVTDDPGLKVTEGSSKVWENGNFVSGVTGITNGRKEDRFLTFSVGSGKYEFTLSSNP
jgi:alpha-L-rhamnosidase